MKRTFFILLLLGGILGTPTFAGNTGNNPLLNANIRKLIIDADITVLLVDRPGDQPDVSGDAKFHQQVYFRREGDVLIIGSYKQQDLKGRGIIYVPAAALSRIEINSNAMVKSLSTLNIPRLDILVNGLCRVVIANNGALNFREKDPYLVEYEYRHQRNPIEPVSLFQ